MFTLICMLVTGLIVVDFLVIFLSSKDDTPAYTSYLQRHFSQLASLAQQLRTLGPPLGRAVQAESVRNTSSLSRSGPGGKTRRGKFNFGVGTGGGREMNLAEMEVWRRLGHCLGQTWSLHQRCH